MARTFTSTLTVELIDKVSAASRRVGAAMERLGGSIGDVTNPRTRLDAAMARNEAALARSRGGLIDAAAGAWMLKGAFDKTTGAAMSLEDKMADIGKVSDMSDAQLKAFEGSLRRMARGEIPMAVEELAELAAAASASGIADNDLEAFTRQVAKSAVAWGVSGEYAGDALAKLKSALGLTIDETARYADAINYLADANAANAPDLIEFARRVAADGKIAGFTNEQVLALGASMMPLLSQLDQVREVTGSVADETNYLGSVQKEFETRSRTGRYALQKFANQLRDVAIVVGQAFLPALKSTLEHLGPIVLKLSAWIEHNDKLVTGIAAAVGGLIGIRVAMAGLRFVALAALSPMMKIGSALLTVGATAGRLWAAAKASVALQQALARMGGGAGLTALQKIGVGLRGMLGAIPGMRTIGSLILRIGTAIGRLAMAIPGISHLARAFAPVGRAIAGVLRSIGLIGPAMTRAATATEAATARMSKAISRVKFSGVLLGASMLSMAASAPDDPSQIGEYRRQNDEAMERAARNTPVIGGAMRAYEGAYRWVHGEEPPSSLPDKARAKGGPISRGEDVLVGEDDPEVITARRSGYVHPNEDVEPRASRRPSDPAAAPAAGPTSMTVNAPITIHAVPGESAEALARRIKEMLERETAFQIRSALADIDLSFGRY